jgi:PST family polysaccharide transporter
MSIPTPAEALAALEAEQVMPRKAAASELDRSLLSGIAWTGGLRWLTQLLTWPVTIVVARILSPKDYGFLGMATIYLGFVALIAEAGLGSVIVVSDVKDRSELAQLNSLSLLFGFGALVISCLLALPLSWFYHAPGLQWVVFALSINLLIDAFRVVPMSILRRDREFKSVATYDATRALTEVLSMLLAAVLGLGYWSLVVGRLAGGAMTTLVVLARHGIGFRVPNFRAQAANIKLAAHFLASRSAWFGYSNADFIVAGKLLGQQALGTYTFAWTFANAPIEKITGLVSAVVPSFFAASKSDLGMLRRYVLLLTEALALILLPALIGLALVARPFVELVLGPKWAGTERPLRFLCLYAAIISVSALQQQLLQATGQASVASRNSIRGLILLPLAFIGLGWRFGATGIALAWLLVYPIVVFPDYTASFRFLQMRLGEYLRSLTPAVTGSAVMAIVVLTLLQLIAGRGWNPAVALATYVAAGGLAYVIIQVVLFRERLVGAVRLIRRSRA